MNQASQPESTPSAVPEDDLETCLDWAVDAFETAWSDDQPPALEAFLPSRETSFYRTVLVELIRLDMEFRWRSGQPKDLANYFDTFQMENFSSQELADLAFEEYRVKFRSGVPVDPTNYAEKYSINVHSWPRWNRDTGVSTARNTKSSARQNFTPPEVGQRFHGFELVGKLGTGAYGTVFLARQEDLANRFVALKVTVASDIEPQSLARLQHTNIIPIYSFQRDEAGQSICMPLAGVATLRDLISAADGDSQSASGMALISTVANRRADTVYQSLTQGEPGGLREALTGPLQANLTLPGLQQTDFRSTMLWFVARAAEGLAYAHSRGIVHGDLKPANILIGDDLEPRLLDFHLARSNHQHSSDALIGGTLPYLSPQHLRSLLGDGEIDESCDIYSLGIILFEAIAGESPYPIRGNDPAAIPQMIVDREELPNFSDYDAFRKQPGLVSIIESCLTHDGQQRYPSARDLQIDLERHLHDLPLKFARNRSWSELMRKWIRRHPRVCSFSSAACLGLSIMLVGFLLASERLNRAAKLEANESSRAFVAQLDDYQDHLLSTHLTGDAATEASDSLSRLIRQRVGSSPAEYRQRLQRLPESLANQELSNFCYSQYLLSMSNTDQGLEFLNTTIEVAADKTPRAIYQRKIELLEDLGQHASAQSLSESLDHVTPIQSVNDSLMSALQNIRNGEFEPAIKQLQQLIAQQPRNDRAWLLLGKAYSKTRKFSRAELCYDTCHSLSSDRSAPLFHLGIDQLNRGQFGAAADSFDRAIELDAANPYHFLNRALAKIALHDHAMAKDDLEQAIKLGVPQTRVHYLHYKVLKRLGQTAAAEASLENFMAQEPQDPVSGISRGMVFIKNNRPAKALQEFRAALDMDPFSVDAMQNIATVQAEFLNAVPEAIEMMTRMLELHPEDYVTKITRGVLHARLGDRPKALADATEVLKQHPSADSFYRAAGVFALTSKQNLADQQIAISLFRRAALADPQLVLSRHADDPDLEPIREMPDFKSVLKSIQALKSSSRQSSSQR